MKLFPKNKNYHIGFEEHTLKEDVVLSKSLEDGSVDSFSHLLANFDGVFAIRENFGFDNGGETIGLADSGIAGKTPGSFSN